MSEPVGARPAEPAQLRRMVPLAPYTSLKVGGRADLFVEARTVPDAALVLEWAADSSTTTRWLGGGSNLLVADSGLSGLAARYLGDSVEPPVDEAGEVIVGAGRSFPNLARALARLGWSGLEWASNVPGTVGGAVVNNAGAFGSCVANDLSWTELLQPDGSQVRLLACELGYDYRTSRLKRGDLGAALVLRAAFRVRRADPKDTVGLIRQFQQQRTATQPRQLSAGSVFANPPGDHAGRLIELAGLKGRRVGGAQISPQHANFIVNLGGATAADVYALIRLAQETVWREQGCWLRPEIELVGRWSEQKRAALLEPARLGSR